MKREMWLFFSPLKFVYGHEVHPDYAVRKAYVSNAKISMAFRLVANLANRECDPITAGAGSMARFISSVSLFDFDTMSTGVSLSGTRPCFR
jgi:hypothetical protein